MSQQALQEVIGRVLLEDEFRLLLFADPEVALTGYELTEAEVSSLRAVDAESLEACAVMLKARIRRNTGSNGIVSEVEPNDSTCYCE